MPGAAAALEVLDGDLTTLAVDAVCNAANTQLLHGGGVAGAIARAAGPELTRESLAVAPVALGEAVATTGGALPCRWVLHAATMELGGPTSGPVIARCTRSVLALADELGCRSLGLVAFGTGVGGFDVAACARIMVGEVREHVAGPTGLSRIVFCVRGAAAADAFRSALDAR